MGRLAQRAMRSRFSPPKFPYALPADICFAARPAARLIHAPTARPYAQLYEVTHETRLIYICSDARMGAGAFPLATR